MCERSKVEEEMEGGKGVRNAGEERGSRQAYRQKRRSAKVVLGR